MRIIHIITGLGNGGAENTLYKICKYDNLNNHLVISLKKPEKYYSLLKKLGIKVYCLDFKIYSIIKFIYLIRLLRCLKPDIVQTWLVHGDFIGGIAARLAGLKNIIWNVRYSNLEFGKAKLSTILIIKILAKFSPLIPKFIIVVSKSAKKTCIELGYDIKKLFLITNGYDLSILKPFKISKIRSKYNIKKKIPILGKIARYDAKKDHYNLLEALNLINKKKIKFYCVLVGGDINKNNVSLVNKIKKFRLSNCTKLLGQKSNIAEIMNEIDLLVQSSSYGEGFPNVVAEAMACGTPCVVTNVGDAAFIVGKTGWVVPPKNPKKLAQAIEKALLLVNKNTFKKKNKSRLRIKKNFDIKKMLNQYRIVWNKLSKIV
tara:strand:- start:3973 stop:5091 length:1119 start_codon:yes stop_codon:yes gene_type:complete